MKKVLSVAVVFVLLFALPLSVRAVYTDNIINFVLRYNVFVADQLPLIKSVEAPQPGTKMDAYAISLNKYASLIAQTTPGTISLGDTMLITSGDGSAMSGAEILLTVGAYFGALGFIDKMDQTGDFAERIGLFAEGALEGRQNKYAVDGYEITFSNTKSMGLFFSVSKP